MAGAKIKEGLDYFPLSTRKDNRFKIIRALHGCEGHVILETLLQDIHGDKGYYVKWSERLAKIFASENAFSFNLVVEVVKDCLIEGIFEEEIFGKYQILTSEEIQKVWINVVKERKEIMHQKEFLLIDISYYIKKNNQEDLGKCESTASQNNSETTLQSTLNSLNQIKERIYSINPPFNGEESINNPSGNTISKQVKQVKEVKQGKEVKEFKQEKKESEAFNLSLLAPNLFPEGEIGFKEKKMDGFFQIKKTNTGIEVLEESFEEEIFPADPGNSENSENINQEKQENGKKENFWEKLPEIGVEKLQNCQNGNNSPDFNPESSNEAEVIPEKWKINEENLKNGKTKKEESGKMENSWALKQEKSGNYAEKIPKTEKQENFTFQNNIKTGKREVCENLKKPKKLPHPARSQIINSWEHKFNQPYQSSYNGNVSINLIIRYLGKLISQNENEIIPEEDKAEKISELWKLILGQWEEMDKFYQNKMGFESIAKYLPEIVNQIKNGFNTKSRGKKKVQVGINLPLTALGNRLISLINSNNMEGYCLFKVGMTPESAIIDGNPIFLCYKKNPKETLNLISFIIIDFARSINIGKNITNYQVDEIAYTIAIRFSDLRIEELFVILANAKIGKYGKLYDRLDITVICDFIRLYLGTERGDYFEKINNPKRHKSIDTLEAIVKTEATNIPVVKELQKEIGSLLKTNLPKREIDPAYKTLNKLPSYNSYLDDVKKLIPMAKEEELLKIHINAMNHNFKELIQITIDEMGKRPTNLIEKARKKILKDQKNHDKKQKSKIYSK